MQSFLFITSCLPLGIPRLHCKEERGLVTGNSFIISYAMLFSRVTLMLDSLTNVLVQMKLQVSAFFIIYVEGF